jgi:hypothetical protein
MGSHSRLKIVMPDETALKPAVSSRAVPAYEMRPIVQVRRIALIEREVREYLSQAALDAVFAHAEIISEGESNSTQGKTTFLGSTMLTIDISLFGEILRESADEGTARRLATLLVKESSLDARIQSIIRREVERITGAKTKTIRGETVIHSQGTRIFLDIDVEAVL